MVITDTLRVFHLQGADIIEHYTCNIHDYIFHSYTARRQNCRAIIQIELSFVYDHGTCVRLGMVSGKLQSAEQRRPIHPQRCISHRPATNITAEILLISPTINQYHTLIDGRCTKSFIVKTEGKQLVVKAQENMQSFLYWPYFVTDM